MSVRKIHGGAVGIVCDGDIGCIWGANDIQLLARREGHVDGLQIGA